MQPSTRKTHELSARAVPVRDARFVPLGRQAARDHGTLNLLRQLPQPFERVSETDGPNDFTAARLRSFDQEEPAAFADQPVYELVFLPSARQPSKYCLIAISIVMLCIGPCPQM